MLKFISQSKGKEELLKLLIKLTIGETNLDCHLISDFQSFIL